ncbi:unnamed protein product [Heligmosomoides polygyrus]|uniref:DDE_3 domain-containing protein n=1 Tax=Heligmosomoides polygyrus TaxID=6339 RepID=A0A183FFU2_HELPZ|nr:unnamed protein product [Heligmosomoides polygyrus]
MGTGASGWPCVFHQDGEPAHTSHCVQHWLSDNSNMFWWKEFWGRMLFSPDSGTVPGAKNRWRMMWIPGMWAETASYPAGDGWGKNSIRPLAPE